MSHSNGTHQPLPRRTLGLIAVSAAVGAGLVLAAWWLLAGQSAGQAAGDNREVMARLDALERRDRTVGPVGSDGPASGSRSFAREATPAGESGGEIILSPAQLAAQAKAMEAEFLRQRPDPASVQRELEILGAMTSPMLMKSGVIPSDPEVECRREACRVTASFRSESDASDWATLYLTTVGAAYASQARQAVVRGADGTVRASLYMAK